MAIDDPKTPKLGDTPTTRFMTRDEMLGKTEGSDGPLIGGEGSSAVGSFLGNVAEGAAGVLAAPFQAIDRGLAAAAGVEYTDERASPIGKLGQGVEEVVQSVAAGDPERADQFVSKLGQGLGSTAGFALPLLGASSRIAGGVGAAGLGAAATGVESAKDYEATRKQAGLPAEQSDQAASFFYGLLPGTLEAVPLARMFGRFDNIVEGGLSAAVKNTAKGTAEEALQEGLQSTAQNLIANNIVRYDPDRDMFFDTPEAATVGGGVGFIMNGLFSAVGLRKRGQIEKAAAQAALDQKPELETQEDEKETGKLNPVTGVELQTSDLAKANLQIMRFERLADEATDSSGKLYRDRIEAIKKEIRQNYLAKDDEGKYVRGEVERQEAEDVLNRIRVEEIEDIEAAPAPVAEAEPFPKKKGIRVNKEITDPKAVKKFNEKLEKSLQKEEIEITDIPAELPTSAELIKTEEVDAEIEEIALDSTPDIPDRSTFFDDKPSNTVFADALQSIKGKRKSRDETAEAYEKRKQFEIAEAYRQRELQRAEEQFEEEQTEAVVQPTTADTIDALPPQQTEEEVLSTETYVSDLDTEIAAAREATRPQAGFGDTLPDLSPTQIQDGTPAFLERGEGIPEKNTGPARGSLEDLRMRFLELTEEVVLADSRSKGAYNTLAKMAAKASEAEDVEGLKNAVLGLEVLKDSPLYTTTNAPPKKVEKHDEKKAKKDNVPLVGAGLVGRKNGAPFASLRAAKAARTRLKLTDADAIVQVDGGFAIKPAKDGLDAYQAIEEAKRSQTEPSKIFKHDGAQPSATEPVIEEEPPKQTIDPEIYNAVIQLSEKMAKDPRPEKFKAYIDANFGNVRAFMSLRAAIMNDEIVPGNTDEVQQTPVGEVENTEATNPEPEVVQAVEVRETPTIATENQVQNTATDLADINKKIANLEKVMESSADPDKIMNRLDHLYEKRDHLQNKLSEDIAEDASTQAFSKSEVDELVELDRNSDDFGYDDEWHADGTKRRNITDKQELVQARKIVSKFAAKIDPAFSKDLEIYFVNEAADIPSKYMNLRNHYEQKYAAGGRGVIFHPRKAGDPNIVMIFGRAGLRPDQYEWTLFHEVVGHYGMRKLFGKDYSNFLDMALKNNDLASRAYAMRNRWKNIDLEYKSGESFVVSDTYDYRSAFIDHKHKFHKRDSKGLQKVSKRGMQRLMDEYVSELAGFMTAGDLAVLNPQEQGFVRRIVAWFRHLLRKSGFGRIAPKIHDGELLMLLKASQENLVRDPVFTPDGKLTPLAQEAQEMTEEVIRTGAQAGLFDGNQARALIRSMDSREGRIDNSWWQQKMDSFTNRVRRGWLGKNFSSTGHLPNPAHLAALENKAKGYISNADKFADRWFKASSKLTDIEKQAVMQYFTTRDASPANLPESVRSMAVDAKQQIFDLGESLVAMGVMRRETFEQNAGQYLPIRYYKYLGGYNASGKKLSFRNYLKQRSDLSDAEKQALGKIEDPSILVAETVATISRDVALHQLYRNMMLLDKQGDLGWFIQGRTRIQVGDKKMTFDDIEKNIERLEKQLALADGEQPLNINEAGRLEMERQMTQLTVARDQVIQQDRREAATRAMRGEGFEGEVTDEMVAEYLRGFTFIKNPAYGPLHNKWVKKELAEELEDQQVSFNGDSIDFFAKWMGPGGKLERGSIYWKKLKVAANPPSVFRNFWGNFILLDMGSTTNTVKLVPKLMGNIKAWATGDSSNPYLRWANDYGLYGTTYSTAELNEIQTKARQRWETVMRNADPEADARASLWNKMVLPGRMFNKYVEAATQFYGNMEGWFKMTAMQDHVEIWERQNNTNIMEVDEATRDAVLREAAATANKNIFDYSKIPGWMRSMRRMPFIGAPFLTFTFKAIPQSIESFARRPQKFIKYAMFPYLMAQAFMTTFDLDDDDMDEIQRMFPQWMKEKSSVYLLPWKDSNGNWVAMDFGYMVPWAPMVDMFYMAQNTFDVSNPLMSTGHTVLNATTNLGFLGGPIPTMVSGILTNKDPFLGTEIIRTTGTAIDKQTDFVRYLTDLWAPSFLTSKGVLGRAMDNLGIEATPISSGREFTPTGRDRETGGQVTARFFGINQNPINMQDARRNHVKRYRYERSQIQKARRKLAKDPNFSPQSRIKKIRELNEQLKVLNQKHREVMQGV